ncbi:MAG: hypothetical protein JXR05_06045 [Flavobacteriaceae bacterium]
MMKKYNLYFLLALFVISGCQKAVNKENEEKVLVFNVANQVELSEFGKLKLDESHLNLLNPKISKDSFEVVYKSWTDLHQNLHGYLVENNFDWGVADEKIKILNRIYFKKNGKVKTYVYRVYNKITDEKAKEYGELMKGFLREEQISLTRGMDFAQCGKMSLPNIKKQKL